MTKGTDHVRSAISAQLNPVLSAAGFHRYQPKHFIRIRGELIDCIAFEMSRYGDKQFHVHYYVNLLSDPAMSVHSYRLGDRLHTAPKADDVPWAGPTEESANAAMHSVVSSVQEFFLPWLDSIASPRDYVYAYVANPTTKMESLQLAIALLLTGTTNRPWWICDSLKDPKFYDSPPDDYETQQMQQASELQLRIDGDTYRNLLSKWKNQNIQSLKLAAR